MTLSDKLEVVKDKKETLKAKSENNTAKQLAYGTEPFLFELGSLCAYLSKVRDGRKARGKRYTLTTILTLLILGKMSGYDQAEAIADWARLRLDELVVMLGLVRKALPHATTYSRIMVSSIKPNDLEGQLHLFRTLTLSQHLTCDIPSDIYHSHHDVACHTTCTLVSRRIVPHVPVWHAFIRSSVYQLKSFRIEEY